ncbi:TerD family protein [Nocardia iowensis]|uniref:TerD family protein n=1 Tax=Nocardia iowensis TaxID=204891 RepID=A0ABX8S0R9_NOCIO|nr:TerD family protein [Nocardia iowensis]QXN95398.1 TerD family protein [Nocardia iowensis]
MRKGTRLSFPLQNSDGTLPEHVAVSLGWDPSDQALFVDFDGTVTPGNRIDLNSAALVFAGEVLVDTVYHEQLVSRDGSISHSGDSPTGEGVGDNEVITVDLARLAPEVTAVIFLATSYSGQSFGQIDNAYYRLFDTTTGTEITRYLLSGGPHTGQVMGKLLRTPQCWYFVGIGEGIYAHHLSEAVPQMARYLP